MGTWNAFYVRALPDSAAAIRKRFPSAKIDAAPQFIGVHMPDDAYVAPESDLAELSASLGTDVLWLGFQSTVDAFIFHHWRSGQHVRSLICGCQEEATWERADGQPESWERSVFFPKEKLDNALEYAENEAAREELRQIWRDAAIQPGQFHPSIDARDCAHQIAAHYGFPHYGP